MIYHSKSVITDKVQLLSKPSGFAGKRAFSPFPCQGFDFIAEIRIMKAVFEKTAGRQGFRLPCTKNGDSPTHFELGV